MNSVNFRSITIVVLIVHAPVAATEFSLSMTGQERQEPAFQREYAESTQQYVDEEIARIIDGEYAKAKELLEKNRAVLDRVSAALLEKETLDEKEFKALIQKKREE